MEIIGAVIGAFGIVLSYFTGRPNVAARFKAVDWPDPNRDDSNVVFVTWRIGRHVVAEIHNSGRVDVQVREVGLSLDNGKLVPIAYGDGLPKVLHPAESLQVNDGFDAVREAVGSARVKDGYVVVGLDSRRRIRLSSEWRRIKSGLPDPV
jgi:hypothetical protein